MPRYFTTDSIAFSLAGCIRSVVFKPRTFFESLETTEEYRNSIIFLLLILSIPALVDSYMIDQEKMISIFPAMQGLGFLFVWLWAGYLYWCVNLFTDNELEHASAFQLAAYSSTPALLDFSPLLLIPAIIWQLMISWRGLVYHVGVESGSATLIMAVPLVMLIAALIAFVMMMALMGVDLVSPLLE